MTADGDSGSNGPVRDLVVIGASAGGVEALKVVVRQLPADLPATVCVVLHIAPTSTSALAGMLARAGSLPCRAALDGDELQHGHILVAPPDHHLVVEDGRVRLSAGPRENGHRPSVDALFRSAAIARDSAVIGVVLSGTRDDGAAGLAVIKSRGGATVVQDPDDALYGGMPSSAIAHVVVDAVAPGRLIAETITALVRGGEMPEGVHASRPLDHAAGTGEELMYASRSLVEAQGAAVEAALWTALRSLEDRAALLRRMADQAYMRGQRRSAQLFRSRAKQAQQQAQLVRTVVEEAAATAQQQRGADEHLEAGEVV